VDAASVVDDPEEDEAVVDDREKEELVTPELEVVESEVVELVGAVVWLWYLFLMLSSSCLLWKALLLPGDELSWAESSSSAAPPNGLAEVETLSSSSTPAAEESLP